SPGNGWAGVRDCPLRRGGQESTAHGKKSRKKLVSRPDRVLQQRRSPHHQMPLPEGSYAESAQHVQAKSPWQEAIAPARPARQLRPPGAAATSSPMELDLDESSLAIGRIERALSRIEKALAERAARPAPLAPASPPESSALKAE